MSALCVVEKPFLTKADWSRPLTGNGFAPAFKQFSLPAVAMNRRALCPGAENNPHLPSFKEIAAKD
ncbi:hypothetical protein, partial [uncultured Bacteroides sp.]